MYLLETLFFIQTNAVEYFLSMGTFSSPLRLKSNSIPSGSCSARLSFTIDVKHTQICMDCVFFGFFCFGLVFIRNLGTSTGYSTGYFKD